MSERTKGEWRTDGFTVWADRDLTNRDYIANCTDNYLYSETQKANAEHICKAVNMHDELVEALEFAREALQCADDCIGSKYLTERGELTPSEIDEILAKILAKAKGESE